jgi:hypothetical protein
MTPLLPLSFFRHENKLVTLRFKACKFTSGTAKIRSSWKKNIYILNLNEYGKSKIWNTK